MTKKTIILFSGWLHNFDNETNLIKGLSKNFDIVVIKYPGYYGEKELNDLPAKYDLSKYVYSKIKGLNLKNYYLLGFSMGCQVVLHTIKKYNLKNKIVLISPTMQSLESEVPSLIKPFLKNKSFFEFIRGNKYLSDLIVNMAYKKISYVTESGTINKNGFNNPNISTVAAFDTLYFLVNNFIDPKEYQKQTHFIFGDREMLQKKLNYDEYETIRDCGHGDFKKNYNKFIKTINKLLSPQS